MTVLQSASHVLRKVDNSYQSTVDSPFVVEPNLESKFNYLFPNWNSIDCGLSTVNC